MGSETYHEREEVLSEETKNLHRAIVSLREELEAIDWYQQRAEACTDSELREILVHNRNEEVEHAMMVLEWLRRRCPVFAENIATYIGASGEITQVEKNAGGSGQEEPGSLGIGSLRRTTGVV